MYKRKTVNFVYSKYLSGMDLDNIIGALYNEYKISLNLKEIEFIIDQKNIYEEIW